jgi:hypothetical protein
VSGFGQVLAGVWRVGAGDGIRTRHVQLGKLAFYP